MGEAEADVEDLLRRAYAAYDRQDLDGLSALVSVDVDWPDGAHRLHGREAVRAYWTEQWTHTRTDDQPVAITRLPDGRVEVRVEQVVRSLGGSVRSTGTFRHLHRVVGAQIVRLDIEPA